MPLLAGRKPPYQVGDPSLRTWAVLACLRVKWHCTSAALILQPELEIWSASESDFSFMISNESSSGLGFTGSLAL
jgi:hypothetical protein